MDNTKINHYKMDKTLVSDKVQGYFENIGISVNKADRYRIPELMGNRVLFSSSDSSSLGAIAASICSNKLLQKSYLEKAGISVTKGGLFKDSEKEQARKMAKALSNTVVKPLHGLQARGVTVGVETDSEFNLAWDKASNATRRKEILVEENFQNGILARYLVVDGKCVSVVEFTKPFITGNGKNTIEELINKKNETRDLNPHLRGTRLVVNEANLNNIENQGYNLLSIPENGKNIILDHKANPQIGSDTIDITDDVHPLFKKVAEDATKAIPGLYVTGIDLLALNHTIDPQKDNYRVIEMNTRAGLRPHIYPLYGYPRNVIEVVGKHILKTVKIDNLTNDLKKAPIEYSEYEKTNNYPEEQNKEPNHYNHIEKSANELISKEFDKKGYKGFFINNYFNVSIDGELITFKGSLTSNFSSFAKQILGSQYWSRKFLIEDGLSIPEGNFFESDCKEEALEYAEKFNMQVQLEYRNRKRTISSAKGFERAWKKLCESYDKHKSRKGQKKRGILITRFSKEEIISRYLVIDGHCVGVIQFTQSENNGLETINITPYVHPKLKRIAEKAAKIVIGSDIVGVDITSKDHLKDPEEVGYSIVKLKVRPSILEFHYPTYGQQQNIAKIIVDYSIHWASRKKQFEELIAPVEEAKIMDELILNNNKSDTKY